MCAENRNTLALFILRKSAEKTALHLQKALGADIICSWASTESPLSLFQSRFRSYRQWVLIMSAGIAVRYLDGLTSDKRSDPAVVVLDEGCHHAIALLCGHEGGANELAFAVANATSATPVVSTATESLKPLVVGIGTRKGVSADSVEAAVIEVLGERSLSEIRCIATVDLKAEEAGLLAFCHKHNLPLRIFSRKDVAARAWLTRPSEWVRNNTGLDGVCEPCALMATPRGTLLVPKTAVNGIAVAVVEDITK